VERYQDQAQAMLRQHTVSAAAARSASHRSVVDITAAAAAQTDDPHHRFGRLLLVLPLLKTVKPRAVEVAFFRGAAASPLADGTAPALPVERLLCEMFKNW